MLPPHELKNKNFTRAMRGYNPVEVDEYVEFLIEKYTELYRENDELDRKLKSTVTKLEELRAEEDSIRSALIDAKRAANRIKADAELQADTIIRSAKASCNSILANFNTKIEEGQQTLVALKSDALDLKQELFERYSAHIESIKALTEGIDMSDVPDTAELRREALASMKAGIAAGLAAAQPEPTPEEAPAEEVEPDEPEFVPTPDSIEDYEAAPEEEIEPDEEDIVFAPSAASDEAETQVFTPAVEVAEPDEQPLEVERAPLSKPAGSGLKDSIRELNKKYKSEDTVNTPDSDSEDDANYLDFVMSVTGKEQKPDPKKEAQFDMLFSDDRNKKKK